MTIINEKVLEETAAMITGMLKDTAEEIDRAYREAGGALTLSMKTTLAPAADSGIKIRSDMNFIKGKVKRSVDRNINPNQMQLFE